MNKSYNKPNRLNKSLIKNKTKQNTLSISKNNKFIIIFTAIFLSTIFTKEYATAKITSNKQNSTNNIEKNIFKNSYHENIWGVYMQKKQPLKSFQIFADLTKKNKYAYKQLIKSLYKTGNNQKIVSIIPLIKSNYPELLKNDPDTSFMVAYALCNNIPTSQITKICQEQSNTCPISYNQEAMDILIPLCNKFQTHQQIIALTSTLYDLNNDPRNAIEITEKYLKQELSNPTDFLEYFKNASRYLKLSDKQNAIKNAKICVELQPKFANGFMLLAAIHDQLGEADKAIEECKKAINVVDPINRGSIEYLMIRLFFKMKGAQHMTTEFVMNKECFNAAIEQIKNNNYDKAFAIMEKCIADKTNTLNKFPTNNTDSLKPSSTQKVPELNKPNREENLNPNMIKIKLIKR